MDDYKQIFEAYKEVNEASFSYAGNYSDSTEQPKRQLAKFRRPKADIKNSTAPRTSMLPTSPGSKISMGAVMSGGGIAENEETDIKGARPVPTSEVHNMFKKKINDVKNLYNQGNYKQLEATLELLVALSRNLK